MRSSSPRKANPTFGSRPSQTLLLPAPMKPTRNIVRPFPRHQTQPGTSWSWAAHRVWCSCMAAFGGPQAAFRQPLCCLVLALLEVNFTAEGKQPNRRCCLVHRTCEGTPCLDHEGSVFGFQREIVHNFASHRAGCHVDRGIIRGAGLDIAAMAGKIIFAAVAKITFIVDLSAGELTCTCGPLTRFSVTSPPTEVISTCPLRMLFSVTEPFNVLHGRGHR